ncbi:hypothetical protein ACFL3O_01340 [Candidatus Neomarinimicrobiota bacterium]
MMMNKMLLEKKYNLNYGKDTFGQYITLWDIQVNDNKNQLAVSTSKGEFGDDSYNIFVYDIYTAKLIYKYSTNYLDCFSKIKFSPDGKYLFIASKPSYENRYNFKDRHLFSFETDSWEKRYLRYPDPILITKGDFEEELSFIGLDSKNNNLVFRLISEAKREQGQYGTMYNYSLIFISHKEMKERYDDPVIIEDEEIDLGTLVNKQDLEQMASFKEIQLIKSDYFKDYNKQFNNIIINCTTSRNEYEHTLIFFNTDAMENFQTIKLEKSLLNQYANYWFDYLFEDSLLAVLSCGINNYYIYIYKDSKFLGEINIQSLKNVTTGKPIGVKFIDSQNIFIFYERGYVDLANIKNYTLVNIYREEKFKTYNRVSRDYINGGLSTHIENYKMLAGNYSQKHDLVFTGVNGNVQGFHINRNK